MRLSLESTLLFLAFAHALVAPVSAREDIVPKGHILSRASHGFRRSALRHSAGLAHDLRVALRGLGAAETAHHRSVLARSNLGKKPYCVSNGTPQSNSTGSTDAHNTLSPFPQPTASRSSTTSPTSRPGQSDFRLAQSYVSIDLIWFLHSAGPGGMERKFADADHLGSPSHFHFSVWSKLFSRLELLHRQRSDQWECPICRSADRSACGPACGPSCAR